MRRISLSSASIRRLPLFLRQSSAITFGSLPVASTATAAIEYQLCVASTAGRRLFHTRCSRLRNDDDDDSDESSGDNTSALRDLLSVNDAVRQQLKNLQEKYDRIANSPQNLSTEDAKEFGWLTRLMETKKRFDGLENDIYTYEQLLKELGTDVDEQERASTLAELDNTKSELKDVEYYLIAYLLDGASNSTGDNAMLDSTSVIVEVRQGTGGDEAGLFAMDLFEMYEKYSYQRGWNFSRLNMSYNDKGGLREGVASVQGYDVFRVLRFESGVHRVYRVPETEKLGRIHTSTATVAVLPEAKDIDIKIDAKDLRIDTMRASGAGGQHVNTTDSAVRITHIPTGTVVVCMDERDYHKNKARAMMILRTRVFEQEQRKRTEELYANRAEQVGQAKRNEKIRTYNSPQDRVTDHRIGKTLFGVDAFLYGDPNFMDDINQALYLWHTVTQFKLMFSAPAASYQKYADSGKGKKKK